MMQLCGNDGPGLAEPAACHGVGPSRGGPMPSFVHPVEHSLSSMSINRTIGCDREPVGAFRSGPDVAVSARERPVRARPARPDAEPPAPGAIECQVWRLAEREVETGGDAEDTVAAAWPLTTVAAPRSEP